MSKLDELIQEYCPDGVGSKALGDVCVIKTGQPVSKVLISKNPGEYPVINSGREPLGFIDKFNTEDDPIGVTSRGAGVGSVTWCPGKYYRGNLNYSVTIRDKRLLDVRFLYFLLMQNQPDIQRLATYQGIPALNKSNLEKLQIPIPPLEVQKEIVSILDKFTHLEAELSAEQEARKKQYEYYRDLLLTFDHSRDDVKELTLEDVIISLKTGLNPRKNFVLNSPGATNYYITVRELNGMGITIFDKTDKVDDEGLRLISNRSRLAEGDVLFSGTGTIGRTALVDSEPTNWNVKEGVYVIKPNTDVIHPKYLLFYLNSSRAKIDYSNRAVGSPVSSVPMSELKRIKIAIPPLDEQSEIVQSLDKFYRLANDIEVGLPAEINARRQQYEYYRSKLLTLQELPA